MRSPKEVSVGMDKVHEGGALGRLVGQGEEPGGGSPFGNQRPSTYSYPVRQTLDTSRGKEQRLIQVMRHQNYNNAKLLGVVNKVYKTRFKTQNSRVPGWFSRLSVGLHSSGHDLMVREFEPHIGLSAVCTEPTSDPP